MNKGNLDLIIPDWPAPANVKSAVTLRTGGVSDGPYESLNMALHVGDDGERVRKNRQIVNTQLKLPSEPVWLDQVHGNGVTRAERGLVRPRFDASFTEESGIVSAVLTADCLPLLICAADGSRVAAVHAGWRGLLAGVIGNTVATFPGRDLLVWLGPAIGPECFEVGSEVREAFLSKSESSIEAFKVGRNGKWLADIYQLARSELAGLGIARVYGGNFCTVTEAGRFFSYRREPVTGRMATLIWRE
ncbi:peptidoglycan editing factor PgeF [Methylosarcina fibrata]|uniref:peptidoglycan editing factor PgeF n=1 Tax=Methylosarcina fibrata TaxID=105972 RepID=UPI000375B19D|nr:peptidoglycan editing factor PgeF [Methylosarcina fibrata]